MRRPILVSLLSCGLSGAGPLAGTALADAPPAKGAAVDEDDDTHVPQPAAKSTAGVYHGVQPGGAELPPRAPHLPVKGPARMTWPGFQVRDGVPTVFLELTSPVEWSVAEGAGKLVYTLRSTTIPLANNQRPLRVGEFQTVVKNVETRKKGRDVEVTIQLRRKVAHKEHVTDGAGGFKFLVIELFP
jgi:hypothetical protein